MTFRDVFKSGFLDNVSSISILDMALALVLAFGLGLFIFFIYKKTYAGVMYSKLRRDARCVDDDYNAGHSGSDIQCGAVARYGGCTVYSEVPHGDQGASGYRLSLLGHCGGYCAGGRNDSACGVRQRADRRHPADLCQS